MLVTFEQNGLIQTVQNFKVFLRNMANYLWQSVNACVTETVFDA